MNNKTVFILGAGFSFPANIPLQNNLLEEILTYKPNFTESAVFIAQSVLRDFLSELFGVQKSIALEDIFTILDRSVLGKERFKNYPWQKLYEIRGQLVYLILFIINKKINSVPEDVKKIYIKFCKKVIHMRRVYGQKSDTIAVISSNWDTLFEIFMNHALSKKQKSDMAVDYCAYTHFFHKGDISHINLKMAGKFNIKLLKLHGSLNWLYCSNCGRLYVDDKDNIGIQNKECPFCKTLSGAPNLLLEPLIITPTFLKEFTNLHIKNIWQNVFVELQEASNVIFIGYSLPEADFEFKYVLKKGIRKDANIQAVLTKKDKTRTKKRYVNFFGKGKVKFNFDELEGWTKANM